MPAANALNAFMTTRQFRQGEEDRAMALEDRQRAIGLENTRGKINALMMQPGEGGAPATGMDTGFAQGQTVQQPSRMDQARQMAVQSGSADVMQQFQQQMSSMDAASREQQAQMFGLVGQVANSLRGVPVNQRGTALMAMAPQLQAAGVPDPEIQNYAQILSDPQSSDAVLEALSSRVLEAQSVFDAYAPQMQGENEVLSRFQNGQQTQGAVNPNAPANRAVAQFGADTNRMNANTNRMNADTARMEAEGQGGPDWVTLEPGDPRRAGFDENDVVQYNTRTGQVARRSVDRVFNATESQAAGFAGRMNDASSVLNSIERLPDFSGVPEFVWSRPTRTLPEQWQRYRQAGENWVRANLRRESGAVIGADEMQAEFRLYMPQPGDSPSVIAQKAAARARSEQAMQAQSRGAYSEYGLDQAPPTRQAAGASANEPSIDDLLNQYGD